MSSDEWMVRRIGTVTGGPRRGVDDDWGDVTATIALDPPFDERSVAGPRRSSATSRWCSSSTGSTRTGVRALAPSAGNPDWPEVGIFAQRAKDRPNRLGLCTCELVAVDGASIVVRGLDAIDGTPVLDVKPYMIEFGPRDDVSPTVWSHELIARLLVGHAARPSVRSTRAPC